MSFGMFHPTKAPGVENTSYLSFLLHKQDFRKPNFTPKKMTKDTKNTQKSLKKVKFMQFFSHSIWKNLHRAIFYHTDKYEVWINPMKRLNKRYAKDARRAAS